MISSSLPKSNKFDPAVPATVAGRGFESVVPRPPRVNPGPAPNQEPDAEAPPRLLERLGCILHNPNNLLILSSAVGNSLDLSQLLLKYRDNRFNLITV